MINIWRDRTDGANHFNTTFAIPKSRNPNGEGQIEVVFDPAINDYEVGDWVFGTSQELSSGIDEAKIYED